MTTPESIKPHSQDYKDKSWEDYELYELGWWVHLFVKRSQHRANVEKRNKDLYDAQDYLNIMQAKLDDLKTGSGK
jgi:hypothetical protein